MQSHPIFKHVSDEVGKRYHSYKRTGTISGETWDESLFNWTLAVILIFFFFFPKRETRSIMGLSVFGRIGKLVSWGLSLF